MYNLTYVERARRTTGCQTAPTRHLCAEVFPSVGSALRRAREILGLYGISAVELYSSSGEIILDAGELARILGASEKRQEPMPEIIPSDGPISGHQPGSTRGSA